MKILHIVHSLRGGGIQNFILSLASEQVVLKNKVKVIIIDKYDSDYCEHLESILQSNGVETFCLNKVRGSKISLFFALKKCLRFVQDYNPDIINTHAEISHLYGGLISRITNNKHVATVHNAPEVWNFLIRTVCKDTPLIFCSKSAFDLRTQQSKKMVAIDNGISKRIIQDNSRVDLRREFGLAKDSKVVILVGSLRPQKNYSFLKDIVDKLQDDKCHFFICGGGDVRQANIDPEEFSKYKNIHFLGLRSDVSAIGNTADLFLSCATFEGLPIAVLEAYFNGIPCVLSPIEQHFRISNIERVWIPEDFSPESFVSAIKKGLACSESHDLISELRRDQLIPYSISNAAEKYMNFYDEAINYN